ncbi:hypothetical protein [Motilibacter deserti]|uniref:Hpr(Ser) kinase/phosphatase n=1 Tax=Motilibacter deserti TaxID=2714956 RepID=A0ABX0GX97_9ACTN|nr:hypothetical protein [Motilibacter deserti]NHC14394.1 hypothetical protein [Motilibacter deserti]
MTAQDLRLDRVALGVLGRRWDLVVPAGRTLGAELLDLVGDLVVPTHEPAEDTWTLRETDGRWQLYRGDALLLASPDGPGLVVDTLRLLNTVAIDDEDVFAVHAAVLALDGRAAIVPAVSGTGKTTLCAAALGAGLTYLTDEAARFPDEEATKVVAYPRPLSLLSASQALLGLAPAPVRSQTEGFYRASLLGNVERGQVDVTVVVVLDRRPGLPEATRLPRSTAAELLLKNSFNHYRDPRGAFLRATAIAAAAPSWLLGYEDAPAAVPLLAGLLSAPRG